MGVLVIFREDNEYKVAGTVNTGEKLLYYGALEFYTSLTVLLVEMKRLQDTLLSAEKARCRSVRRACYHFHKIWSIYLGYLLARHCSECFTNINSLRPH